MRKKFLLLQAVLCILLCLAPASAANTEGAAPTATLSVLNLIDNQPVGNTAVSAYRVADINDDKLTWTEEYAGYRLTLKPEDTDSFAALPKTLEQLIKRDSLPAAASAVTGNDGKAAFKDLAPGLYVVTGGSTWRGNYLYSTVPALAALPYLEDGRLNYEGNLEFKHESAYYPPSTAKPTLTRHVLKVWNDEGYEDERPASVTIQLLSDGKVKDTVHLNAANNWRHTWKGLDAKRNWYVLESESGENYTCNIQQDGVTFVVTNTLLVDVPDHEKPGAKPDDPVPSESPDPGAPSESPIPSEPGKPDEPSESPTPGGPVESPIPSEPGKPDEPSGSPAPNKPSIPDKPDNNTSDDITDTPDNKLPQTGQQWVVIFAATIVGIVFILAGLVVLLRRKRLVCCLFVLIGTALILCAGVWTFDNAMDNAAAGRYAQGLLEKTEEIIENSSVKGENSTLDLSYTPDYILDPSRPMPEAEVDGKRCVGTISLPSLDLILPVQSSCNEAQMLASPGIYCGSIYTNDCIIAGHNFTAHFGRLDRLIPGDTVLFTDMDGNNFLYQVASLETVDGTDVEGAKSGNWDLTLLTCTLSGRSRILVRCLLDRGTAA